MYSSNKCVRPTKPAAPVWEAGCFSSLRSRLRPGMRHLLPAIAALLLLLPSAAAQDYDKGQEAAKRGDFATASREWRPLAAQGHAKAQYGLGVMYHRGDGVPQSYAEARKWYRLAAEQGNAKAQYGLSFLYYHGHGVPRDYAEAIKWVRPAAEQGLADAQFRLGFMYFAGQGLSMNHTEAAHWYRKAAEQGNVAALNNLGVLYKYGYGVPSDYVQAHMWYNLAAIQGAEKAADNRDSVGRRMTPAQIAEAQRLAREWMDQHGR